MKESAFDKEFRWDQIVQEDLEKIFPQDTEDDRVLLEKPESEISISPILISLPKEVA